MTSTIILVSLLFGLVALEVVLWAVFLRWGLRWAKVQGVTWRRVALATLLAGVLQVPIAIGQRLLSPASAAQAALLGLGGLLANVLVAWSAIAVVCKARFLRAAQAWLPTLIPSLGLVLFALLIMVPYLGETFAITTNSMAPTLLGKHWRGVCAQCGQPRSRRA